MTTRKVIQLIPVGEANGLVALCDDGVMFEFCQQRDPNDSVKIEWKWIRIADVPQDGPT